MSVPILCYHKVSADAAEERWLNVHPRRLAEHVRFFERRGYRFTTAAALASQWPARGVCMTFDDAYESTMSEGVEVLNSRGAKATFYAVSERVGATSDWDGDRARPLAGWDTLLAAAKAGHEIGNHTAHHARLSDLGREEQRREIALCAEAIRLRGLPASSFCFPYGCFDETTLDLLDEEGYRIGMALGKRSAEAGDDRRRLPRLVMSYGDSIAMLLYKLYIRPKIR